MEANNLSLAKELISFLKRNSVHKIVLCSGSRNAPLVFSLQSNRFDIYHHVDERAAAFFALGLSMKKREPIAVLCTSGTAVAEMLPACIEAYYQQLPLLLISADRPVNYRGTAAPQAIEQVGIFSHYAQTVDVNHQDSYPKTFKYPLHLNICLAEPAEGDWLNEELPILEQKVAESPLHSEFKEASAAQAQALQDFLKNPSELLVVVGSLALSDAAPVYDFLLKLGAPVLADSTSNLSENCSSLFLDCGEKVVSKMKPQKVLRLGSVPSFRFWRDLENNSMDVLSLSREGFSGLARSSNFYKVEDFLFLNQINSKVAGVYSRNCFERSSELKKQLDLLLEKYPHSELAYLRALKKFISPNHALYLGNSLPIREWNLVNGLHSPSYANRGANGIDGQLSTFLGVAENESTAWAVVGDQTALYDLNALLVSNQRLKNGFGKRRVVVVNNGGGKIFSHLKYSRSLSLQQSKLIENQHRWNFAPWAEMFAWAYEAWVDGAIPIDEKIDDLVLEIIPDSYQTQQFWAEWRSL